MSEVNRFYSIYGNIAVIFIKAAKSVFGLFSIFSKIKGLPKNGSPDMVCIGSVFFYNTLLRNVLSLSFFGFPKNSSGAASSIK